MTHESPLSIPEDIPDDPLAAALLYAKHGWYVIPVRQGTKNPGSVLGKDWPTRSTRDPEQIAALWAGTNHGIALHVGRSGAVVFDVDDPDKLDVELDSMLGHAPFQSTRETRMRRGHYVFATDRPLGNSLGALPKGWGDIRGANGVIVVQPSMHPEHDSHGGWYQWVTTGPVPWLPEPLDAALPDLQDTAASATDEAVLAFLSDHRAESRPQLVAGWVRGFERDVRDGASRHTSMATRLAGAMKEAKAGYFAAARAASDLRGVFIDAVTQDGWAGEQGSARTERQAGFEFDGLLAWAVGQANAADVAAIEARTTEKTAKLDADEAMFDLENLAHPKDERGAEPEHEDSTGLPMYLARSELDKMPRGEPLIDGVIDRHVVGVLSGRDQTYKSFFLLDMMLCLATGTSFNGHSVERTPVLLVVGEGAWGLGQRVAAWEAHQGVRVEDEWFHVRRAPVNLFSGRAVEELAARVSEYGYGFVAFDTLQRNTAGADANSAKDAGVIASYLDRIRVATDRGSVLFVAHTGKDDQDVRGSSAFEDDADIVWRAKKLADDSVRFSLTKRKDGPDGLSFRLGAHAANGSLVLLPARLLGETGDKQPAQAVPILEVLGNPVNSRGLSLSALGRELGLGGKGGLSGPVQWLMERKLVADAGSSVRSCFVLTSAGASELERIRDLHE